MNYIQRILSVLNTPIKEGQMRWTFKKHRKVICGWELGFNVPMNSSYEEATKLLPALVATIGHEVELLKFKGLVVVRIIEKEWETEIPFNPKHLKQNELLIGYDRLMNPIYHPLEVHILNGGASGSGKTVWLMLTVYQLLLQGYEVYVCDMKGGSFDPFEGLITLADDLKSSQKILMGLIKELEIRKAIIKSKERGNKEETIATFKPIVVIIDEAADLSPTRYASKTQNKEWAFDCDYAIEFIGRKGREWKVLCIYGTQRPDMRTINKQFKDNVEASIAFRCKDHYASEIIIDRTGAELIDPKHKGRCIYSHGVDTLVQVPYVGKSKEWEKLLAPLKKGMIIEHGNSQRKNAQRKYTEGSFTGSDSANGSDSQTIHKQLKPPQKGQSESTGTTTREAFGVRLASSREDMATQRKRIEVNDYYADED